MNEEAEKQKIREVIATWLRATADGDLQRVMGLMAEDVVFLVAGQPPMRGRQAYAAAAHPALAEFRIEGRPDILEIRIAGDYAFVWNHLSITMTPRKGGSPRKHAGHILSVFRREADGRWVLLRDANFVAPV
jgi:uncharacterized protein (TIGR02246 family)